MRSLVVVNLKDVQFVYSNMEFCEDQQRNEFLVCFSTGKRDVQERNVIFSIPNAIEIKYAMREVAKRHCWPKSYNDL